MGSRSLAAEPRKCARHQPKELSRLQLDSPSHGPGQKEPILFSAVTASIAQERQVYRVGNGVSSPTPIKKVKAGYTPEAEAARIQGTVVVEAVVREDGTVGNTNVTRSLDAKYGLDAEAVKATKKWTFKPAMRDGKPVPVLVTIDMAFTLPRR